MQDIGCDFLIIGGGIIGLATALALRQVFSTARIIIIDKEAECGWHASGRNSGVLHAGFYYSQDSLKAKFTKSGNKMLAAYCLKHDIPLNKCGKLVVTKNEEELAALDILLERGAKNNVIVQELTEKQAIAIEPRALTYKRALFSPTTAVTAPGLVVRQLRKDAENAGILIHCHTKYLMRGNEHNIITTQGKYSPGFVVNAAGLYADRIAQDYNFSKYYRILPFKGLYLYSNAAKPTIKTLIYPVPNLNNPFLGVHVTITAEGKVKLGPTAIPAFWREQYAAWNRFNVKEFIEILYRQIGLIAYAKFNFRQLAIAEIRKYSKRHLVNLSMSLAQGLETKHFTQYGIPGIRAQLLNIKAKKLVMDFIIEGNKKSLHILNAVSPGFTCALPFGQYICEKIKLLLATS